MKRLKMFEHLRKNFTNCNGPEDKTLAQIQTAERCNDVPFCQQVSFASNSIASNTHGWVGLLNALVIKA